MKPMSRVRIVIASVMLALVPQLASSQTADTGSVSGVVKDVHGAPIPNAAIVVAGEKGAEFRVTADASGAWKVASLPAGAYTVTATAPAAVTGVLKDVRVASGAAATADLTLLVGLSERVVVTASRVEEEQINAPAVVTILNERRLEAIPTQNYADAMRQVPGVNVVQMSARDFNVTPRHSANVPAASQLVLVDGRPINQDYYGYVAWDFVPTMFGQVKRVEVLSGAASAVWGAYAMNGVVNILTKAPREMPGTSLTVAGGWFDRSGGVAESDTGSLFYGSVSHARVLNDRWSFKGSAGYNESDAFARPSGNIPNSFQTPYPTFTNYGTKQPKAEARLDYDSPDGIQHLSFSAGYAGTGGTFHTGLGPFHLENGASGTYAKADYRRNGWTVTSYGNFWRGEASSLLAVGPLGVPLDLEFRDNSWDLGIQKNTVLGKRHALTFGGNFKHNWVSITMAPGAESRQQYGVFGQDSIFLSRYVRLEIGARVDKYSSLDDPLFAPRAALLLKPAENHTLRVSYSRAYRAPSLFQNHLDTVVVNRVNLGVLNPALAGRFFFFQIHGLGNLNLEPQTLDAFETSYSVSLAGGKVHAATAFYLTDSRHDMILTQTDSYTSKNPPAGWPLPPAVLDALIAANAFGPGLGLPSVLSFQNLGEVRNKGFEISVDAQVDRHFNVFANYSWQDKPVPKDFLISKINLPPTNRFNAGITANYGRLIGDVAVQYTSSAYFRDVLDATYAGYTKPFTVVNLSAGAQIVRDRVNLVMKIRNVANEPVQNHLFGDLLKRQITFELNISK